jgi:acetyltransferase-like isoleucine patch superfamily enzyme
MSHRTDNCTVRTFEDEKNPLRHWMGLRNPIIVLLNSAVVAIAQYLPLNLKNILLRLTGMDVGSNVAIGMKAIFDIFHPEQISIGDNTTIGYRTSILTHEATQDELRTGPVEIGDDVLIGTNCTVLPGVTIGDGATVSAQSLVNKDVPPGAFVGGVPIERLDDGEE